MKKTLCWVSMLLAVILILPSAGSAGKVRGVTDTEVVIGWTTPLSGPAALWGVTALGGKAWADYINDQGGINGRKIKVILKDDGYNPARAMANLRKQFFRKLHSLSKSFFDNHKTGWLVARSTGDMAVIQDFMTFALMMSGFLITLMASALPRISAIAPILLAPAAIIMPLMIFISFMQNAANESFARLRANTFHLLVSFIYSIFNNILTGQPAELNQILVVIPWPVEYLPAHLFRTGFKPYSKKEQVCIFKGLQQVTVILDLGGQSDIGTEFQRLCK